MNNKYLTTSLALLTLACGDDADDTNNPDAAGIAPDAGTADAAMASRVEGSILALGGDYAGNGIASLVSLDDLEVESNAVAGVVGGDPALRRFGDRIYILDRFNGDSLTVLDEDLTLLHQISTEPGSNPQDVTVVEDVAYVVTYDGASLVTVNLSADEPVVGTLGDLSNLDIDGAPDCVAVEAVGDKLYVSCGLLDRTTFAPRAKGVVAVIDRESGEIESTIELSNENPFGWMARGDQGELYVATVPDFFDTTAGCLERIETDGTPRSLGCVATHAALGGFVSAMSYSEGALTAVVTASAEEATIQRYDGSTWVELLGNVEMNPTDMTYCENSNLVVADTTLEQRGIRVFEAGSEENAYQERTDGALDVGWPESFAPIRSMLCW